MAYALTNGRSSRGHESKHSSSKRSNARHVLIVPCFPLPFCKRRQGIISALSFPQAKKMPVKRRASAVKFRRSTRAWPLRMSQQINEAMKHAKAANTPEQWSEADRLFTALGDLAPPLLLPAE